MEGGAKAIAKTTLPQSLQVTEGGDVTSRASADPDGDDENDNMARQPWRSKRWYKKSAVYLIDVVTCTSGLLDFVTDLRLMYKAQNDGALLLTVTLFISLFSPYVLSYSSGIKLFTFRKTFDRLHGLQTLWMLLYLFPTGFLYFLAIDVIEILFTFYKWLEYHVRCKDERTLVDIEEFLAQQLGMSRMDWEGFKRQRTVGQIMFETIPQVILQSLAAFSVIELTGTSISRTDILVSIAFAVVNSVAQITQLHFESLAVHETFVQYALLCAMGRVGWVPFKAEIEQLAEQLAKQSIQGRAQVVIEPQKSSSAGLHEISFEIQYTIPCVPINRAVEFDFSSMTIRHLIATLSILRVPTNASHCMSIRFGNSLRLLGAPDLALLLETCQRKNILLPDVASKINWTHAFKMSAHDPRLISHNRDRNGRPLLTRLYCGNHDDADGTMLKQLLRNDVPVDVEDANGETLVYHLLRNGDKEALRILFSIQKEKNFKISLSMYNKDNISPLGLALQNMHEEIELELQLQLQAASASKHVVEEEIDKPQSVRGHDADEPANDAGQIEDAAEVSIEEKHNDEKEQLHDQQKDQGVHDSHAAKAAREFSWEQAVARAVEAGFQPATALNGIEFKLKQDLHQNLALLFEHRRVIDCIYKYLIALETGAKPVMTKFQSALQNDPHKEVLAIFGQFEPTDANKDQLLSLKAAVSSYLESHDLQIFCPLQGEWSAYMRQFVEQQQQSRQQWAECMNQIQERELVKIRQERAQFEAGYFTHRDHDKANSTDREHDRTIAVDDQQPKPAAFMYQLLLAQGADANFVCSASGESPLAYVLSHHFERISVVDDLISYGAILHGKECLKIAHLFVDCVTLFDDDETNAKYLDVCQNICKASKTDLLHVVNERGDNPLHLAIERKLRIPNALRQLWKCFPRWLQQKNDKGVCPLGFAVQLRDLDSVLCLGALCDDLNHMMALVSHREFDHYNERTSLLAYFREQKLNSVLEFPTSEFEVTGSYMVERNNEEKIVKEPSERDEDQKTQTEIAVEPEAEAKDEIVDDDDREAAAENEREQDVDDEQFAEKPVALRWVERFYSLTVECLSTADFITDIIILRDLWLSNNIWWTTIMLSLLIAPYLVCYSAMGTIIQNRLKRNSMRIKYDVAEVRHTCIRCRWFALNMLVFLLMTPLCIGYFVVIDFVFMVYIIFASALLFLSCEKIDIVDVVDDWVFKKLFGLNRMQIIGYRRLRTLSQLFFETIPQIFLQLRILWSLQTDDENQFEIDTKAIIWSIVFALLHLLLECIIIFLDSSASKMSFLHYGFVCLGGRLQWIPFSDKIGDQLIMTEKMGDQQITVRSEYFFDPEEQHTSYNYEDIDANLCKLRYKLEFQFSNESINELAEIVSFLPEQRMPSTTDNMMLKSMFDSILLRKRPELVLGNKSCYNVNFSAISNLCRSAARRVHLNLDHVDWSRMTSNISNIDTQQLLFDSEVWLSQLSAARLYMERVVMQHGALDTASLKALIISKALGGQNGLQINSASSFQFENNFAVLRKYYSHGLMFGLRCGLMKTIHKYVKHCLQKAAQGDASYLHVAMLILWFTRSTVYHHQCSLGCCTLKLESLDPKRDAQDIQSMRRLLQQLPSTVRVGSWQMSLKLLECFSVFKVHVEELLLNHAREPMASPSLTIDDAYTLDHLGVNVIDLCGQIEQEDIDLLQRIIDTTIDAVQPFPVNNDFLIKIKKMDVLVNTLNMEYDFNKYVWSTIGYRTIEMKTVGGSGIIHGDLHLDGIESELISIDLPELMSTYNSRANPLCITRLAFSFENLKTEGSIFNDFGRIKLWYNAPIHALDSASSQLDNTSGWNRVFMKDDLLSQAQTIFVSLKTSLALCMYTRQLLGHGTAEPLYLELSANAGCAVRCDFIKLEVDFFRMMTANANEMAAAFDYDHHKMWYGHVGITCPYLLKDNACPILDEVRREKESYTEKNYQHLCEYTHFEDEFADKPKCYEEEDCETFKRMEKGGNRLDDLCHFKVLRHPPRRERNQALTQENMRALVMNTGSEQENHELYSPTDDDKVRYAWNKKDGWLKALIEEVIRNGFKCDLCLTCGPYEECTHNDYSLLTVVDAKMRHPRHELVGSVLSRDQMLALVLYTVCSWLLYCFIKRRRILFKCK